MLIQAQHEREYQDALVNIKEKIREAEGPDIKENMQDQIRQWFIETRYGQTSSGTFPQTLTGALFYSSTFDIVISLSA